MEAATSDSQQITPARSRVVLIILWIWSFIWLWAKRILLTIGSIWAFIWLWARRINRRIWFEWPKKLPRTKELKDHHLEEIYVYVRILFKGSYLLSWVILFLWYCTVRLGCTSQMFRPHLNSICLRPYVDPNARLPWYLDYWDTSAESDDFPDTLSLSNEALMIGYLDIHDIVADWRLQASELKRLPSGLYDNLRQLIDTASDFSPQLAKCADKICKEQDAINHAFENFVTFWGRAITMSTYHYILIPGLACPWWVLLGHLRYHMNITFLPQPRFFLFQVEAEMRYQKQLLIDSLTTALDKIDKRCSFPDPAQRTQVLEVLMEKITSYQKKVKRNIKDSCPIWHNVFLYKTETCVTLENLDTLGESVRRRVQKIGYIIDTSKAHYRRIRTSLQDFEDFIHNSPSSGLSYNGEFIIQRPLEPYIEETSFLIRRKNLEPNGSSVNPHPFVYSYDLSFDNGTPLPVLRSKVAQLCKESNNFNMVSGDLYMICAIQALEAKISDLNDDNVSGRRASWFIQRHQALSRYEQMKELDEESLLRYYVGAHRAHKKGTSVPEGT